MILIYDNRAALKDHPSLHVLIAGVSAYPHLPKGNEPRTPQSFGMRQLSSAALSAYKIYRWLINCSQNFPVPLATCRLLLSPSTEEITAEPTLQGLADSCTLDNFLLAANHWREDASSHKENMTLFYFAGHGLQRSMEDLVLLLEGFGDGIGGLLRSTVAVNNLFIGMVSSEIRPKMARTQLYLIDCGRNSPSMFRSFEKEDATSVFSVQFTSVDNRIAPIFYGSVPGSKAISIPGDQTLFSKALLDCLNGGAGELREVDGQERWCVSVLTLLEALKTKVEDWNKTLGAEQEFTLSGLVRDAIICFLDQPPSVEVVLEVDPPDALNFVKIEVRDEQGMLVLELPTPLDPNPYHCKLTAGFYQIEAIIDPPNPHYVNLPGRLRLVMPPRYHKTVKVSRE